MMIETAAKFEQNEGVSPPKTKPETRKMIWEVAMSALLVAGTSLLLLFLELGVIPPTRRGFFCGDITLGYPYRSSTVPTWFMIVTCWGGPNLVFFITEILVRRQFVLYYYTAAVFNFVYFADLVVTDFVKLAVGQPRPHFLDACGPDVLVNATCADIGPNQFIEEFRCTNPHGLRAAKMDDASLSFPSGHASMSMSSGAFLLLYCWRRFKTTPPYTLHMVIFFAVAAFSSFTTASRLMDYKHFASDVAGGYFLGAIFALFGGLLWWQSMEFWEACRRGTKSESSSLTPLSPECPDVDLNDRVPFAGEPSIPTSVSDNNVI